MALPSIFFIAFAALSTSGSKVEWIMTATDQSKKFELQSPLTPTNGFPSEQNIVTIDEDITYQNVYGFGAAVTR